MSAPQLVLVVTNIYDIEYIQQSISQELCIPGFAVFCCVLILIDFTHILQGYFTGTGAIVWLPQCQWSNPEGYDLMDHMNSQPKYNKTKPCAELINGYWMHMVDFALFCCSYVANSWWNTLIISPYSPLLLHWPKDSDDYPSASEATLKDMVTQPTGNEPHQNQNKQSANGVHNWEKQVSKAGISNLTPQIRDYFSLLLVPASGTYVSNSGKELAFVEIELILKCRDVLRKNFYSYMINLGIYNITSL